MVQHLTPFGRQYKTVVSRGLAGCCRQRQPNRRPVISRIGGARSNKKKNVGGVAWANDVGAKRGGRGEGDG